VGPAFTELPRVSYAYPGSPEVSTTRASPREGKPGRASNFNSRTFRTSPC
jgi:hypothetical protein